LPRSRPHLPDRRAAVRPKGRRRGPLYGRAGDARATDRAARARRRAGGGRPMSWRRPLEVAIVGMGCRFPAAPDLCAFWENILAGRDCIRDVPPDRWDPGTFVDPSSTANDRLPGSRGGYLDSPIPFDAAGHGIKPRTIEGGEPEQFLV